MKRRAAIFALAFAMLLLMFTTVAFAGDALPDGYVGTYYKTYIALKSEGSCWITDGDIPDGLSCGSDSKGYFIYGTPTGAGTWYFRVNTDIGGGTNYQLTIRSNDYYCVNINVISAPTKTQYNVGESFDPAGLVVSALFENALGQEKRGDVTNEVYFDVPAFNKAGNAVIMIYADLPDYNGYLNTFAASITVSVVDNKPKVDPPAFITTSLPEATVGKNYSVELKYSGQGVSFSEYWDSGASSQLAAAGLEISRSGRISGTPKKAGKYTITICAKNEGGTAYQKYTLNVRQAETGDGLWVNGVAVNEKNRKDILGDGTASYDRDAGVLTLSSAKFTELYSKNGTGYAIYSELKDGLVISLKGENSIVLGKNGKQAGIYAAGKKLTFEGDSLGITAAEGECLGIFSDGDIVIDCAGLEISVPGTAVRSENGKLIYNSGTLELTGTENALFARGGFEYPDGSISIAEGTEAPGEHVDAVTSDGDAVSSLQYLMIKPSSGDNMSFTGIGGGKPHDEKSSSQPEDSENSGSENDSESKPEASEPEKGTAEGGLARWPRILWIAVGGVIVAGGATAGIVVAVTKSQNKGGRRQ